jgi:ketosteroid isomerase-like protein
MRLTFITLITLVFASCGANNTDNANARTKAIQEIETAEKDFQKMSADKGIMEAFWFYADSNAVIKRENDTLIKGKDGIRNYYSAAFYKQATVTWSPDFTDASAQGDFGYTYGKYTWQSKDSTGKLNEYKGVFHTVWKRQADGSWKYVWD